MTPSPRYRRRRRLSQSAHFDIWLTDDTATGEAVAIKAAVGGAPAALRLAAELKARRACHSIGFIPLREDASSAALPHLVLDFLPHCHFEDLTAPYANGLVRPIINRLLSIATSLQHAGLTHGAINGASVLISRGPTVHLTGLGGILPITAATAGDDALAIGTLLARCITLPADAWSSLSERRPGAEDQLLVDVAGALTDPDPHERMSTLRAFTLLAGAA